MAAGNTLIFTPMRGSRIGPSSVYFDVMGPPEDSAV